MQMTFRSKAMARVEMLDLTVPLAPYHLGSSNIQSADDPHAGLIEFFDGWTEIASGESIAAGLDHASRDGNTPIGTGISLRSVSRTPGYGANVDVYDGGKGLEANTDDHKRSSVESLRLSGSAPTSSPRAAGAIGLP